MTITDHTRQELESEGLEFNAASADSRAKRYQSFGIENHPIPTGQEEEWRFASLRALYPLFAEDPSLINTKAKALSYEYEEIPGVRVEQRDCAALNKGLLVPEDRIAAAAAELSEQALHFKVERDLEVAEPIRLEIKGQHKEASYGAITLETAPNSSATFVLNHTGQALYGQNVEIIARKGSHLTLISIQDWEDDAIHVATHVAVVEQDAKIKHIVVSLGGAAVRVNSTTKLKEIGGEVEQIGLYFADEHQHLEHRLFVDHQAPKCTSNVTYKGALQGRGARSVWVGDVLIRKAAEGTNTYELNRNLVLTEGARADSVPNLEIETGEIEGAGHAAATGRFDDEQLFYLMARGIDEVEARRLVVRGFFQELIQQIEVEEIRQYLSEQIENELTRSMN